MVDYPKDGSRDYRYDGTVEQQDNSGVAYAVFGLFLTFMAGLLLGSMIASSATVGSVKEHYCIRYMNTQEYIACKNKPIQEIYALMDKH